MQEMHAQNVAITAANTELNCKLNILVASAETAKAEKEFKNQEKARKKLAKAHAIKTPRFCKAKSTRRQSPLWLQGEIQGISQSLLWLMPWGTALWLRD